VAESITIADSYEFHRLRCLAAAEVWERAAETARAAGNFLTSRACTEYAVRMRYLAEPDEAVRSLFNAAERLVAEERQKRAEVPRD